LSAKSAPVCESCHALFLAGERTRVEVARRDHEARGYRPAEWIDRIDRDQLLDISCLSCGVLLPIDGAAPERFICPRCQAVNHFAERHSVAGATRVTARLDEAPR
jgi:phage FluMu protein Com